MTRPLGQALPAGLLVLLLFALATAKAAAEDDNSAGTPVMAALQGDVVTHEPPPWEEPVHPVAGSSHESPAPGFAETSEYMIGSVAVGVLFLESNGAVDPSTENWTAAEKSFALSQLQRALDWWVAQEPAARLSFVTEVIQEVSIGYEPISRQGSGNPDAYGLWMTEAMKSLGFPKQYDFSQWRYPWLGAEYEYVDDLRQRKGTDWAFVVFMVRDVNDPDHTFAASPDSSGLSFAGLGGPDLVSLYTNGNWGSENLHKVIAHEMGHVFYATDTYDNKQKSSGYFNTPDVDGRFGLMNENDLYLPQDTRLQIGWRDSDGDGILDPADTTPQVSLTTQGPGPTDRTTLEYRGTIREVPLTNQNPWGSKRSVTINRVQSVSYRLNGGPWREASPVDGSFGATNEEFTFTLSGLSDGQNTIEVKAANTVGNSSLQITDRVLVTRIVIDDARLSTTRANVGSTQQLRLHLSWAHDRSPVTSGAVTVDGGAAQSIDSGGWATVPLMSGKVGMVTPQVTAVRSGTITRHETRVLVPSVVWDRIKVTSVEADDSRVDIETAVIVLARAELEYDGTPLAQDDSLSIGGQTALWDATTKAFRIEGTKRDVGLVAFRVTSGRHKGFGITALAEGGPALSVVWDRIKVTEVTPSRPRADVGSAQSVSVKAVLEHDRTPLGAADALFVNGLPASWDAATQAFRLEHHANSVGSVTFRATAARQSAHGISTLNNPVGPVSIIWDEVTISLSSDRERIDVGSEAPLRIVATHTFDGAPFQGDVVLNGPTRRDGVGPWRFEVKEIKDAHFGLTRFAGNQETIVWDRVAAALATDLERIEVGSQAPIHSSARYESDGAPFEGIIGLNRELVYNTLGPQAFTVSTVADERYKLTAFTANTVTVTFDRIESSQTLDTLVPGRIRAQGALSFASDGAPVRAARVSLGATSVLTDDSGQYDAVAAAWSPWTTVDFTATVDGFQPIERELTGVHQGNLGASAALVFAFGGAGVLLIRRTRLGQRR
ncbi:MAG: hypothetical protein HY685_05625 [Chloroflexi bacterium]|nr:hypothetical protein [Chloroflexota bacterium]